MLGGVVLRRFTRELLRLISVMEYYMRRVALYGRSFPPFHGEIYCNFIVSSCVGTATSGGQLVPAADGGNTMGNRIPRRGSQTESGVFKSSLGVDTIGYVLSRSIILTITEYEAPNTLFISRSAS